MSARIITEITQTPDGLHIGIDSNIDSTATPMERTYAEHARQDAITFAEAVKHAATLLSQDKSGNDPGGENA